jgi:predicted CXXCH cytochrome family protein
MSRKNISLLLVAALLIMGVALFSRAATNISVAAPEEPTMPQVVAQEGGDEEPAPPSNAYCLLCHSQPDQTWTLPSGETLSLTVETEILASSVHGDANPEGPLNCVDCHIDERYPHEPSLAQSARDFTLSRYAACRTCHEDQYTRAQDSVHGAALRNGITEAAVCVDCHGAHDIQTPHEPRQRITVTCGQCHGAIFDLYRTSVHGEALLQENDPNVPTCVDCHGVHDIENPETTQFRVRSPEVCATCHNDPALMAEYGISTNVFDSYLTDFHGSTVALFEQQDPGVVTNKAVCYDCHGVHDIQQVDDEHTQLIRENLLDTCQQCHPDATANFSDAWIGHYEATADSNTLVYVVNGLNNVFIPLITGAFGLLLATDVIRRIRQRLSSGHHDGSPQSGA